MPNRQIDLSTKIAGVNFKNPITTASGTFSARDFHEYIDLNQLGAITVKGVAANPWQGNATPRIAETYGGMLNSVGLQNPGIEYFIEKELPFIKQFDTKVIVNIAGKTIEEYCQVAEALQGQSIDLIELNISCPNVKEGGVAFGTDTKMAELVTQEVKKRCEQPLIVKLSPNVTDIREIAKAVVSGGADAISMINTLIGMKIDIYKRKPILANNIGGLSGPAIKPVAVRMINQVAQVVEVPIIGMGGVMTGEDAIEMIMAGATGVAVGTANLINPRATMEVLEGIEKFMIENKIKSLDEIRNIIKL